MTKQDCFYCHDTAPLIARIDELSQEVIRLKEELRGKAELQKLYDDLRFRMDGLEK